MEYESHSCWIKKKGRIIMVYNRLGHPNILTFSHSAHCIPYNSLMNITFWPTTMCHVLHLDIHKYIHYRFLYTHITNFSLFALTISQSILDSSSCTLYMSLFFPLCFWHQSNQYDHQKCWCHHQHSCSHPCKTQLYTQFILLPIIFNTSGSYMPSPFQWECLLFQLT